MTRARSTATLTILSNPLRGITGVPGRVDRGQHRLLPLLDRWPPGPIHWFVTWLRPKWGALNAGVEPMADGRQNADHVLAAARGGSLEALGNALEGWRRYLLAIAEGQLDGDLRAKGGASDLVQETFLEAQRDFERFRGSSPDELRAWLRQVLLNNVGAFTRRFRTTGKRAVSLEIAIHHDGSSAGAGEVFAASGLSPSGVAIEHEQGAALRRAIGRLPDDYRQVVFLRFEEGRSFEEIGQLTDRSADAARKLWARAMERLRQEWENPC